MWCAKMRNFDGPRFMKDAERKKSFQQPFKKVSFWKNDKNCHSLIIIVVIFKLFLVIFGNFHGKVAYLSPSSPEEACTFHLWSLEGLKEHETRQGWCHDL